MMSSASPEAPPPCAPMMPPLPGPPRHCRCPHPRHTPTPALIHAHRLRQPLLKPSTLFWPSPSPRQASPRTPPELCPPDACASPDAATRGLAAGPGVGCGGATQRQGGCVGGGGGCGAGRGGGLLLATTTARREGRQARPAAALPAPAVLPKRLCRRGLAAVQGGLLPHVLHEGEPGGVGGGREGALPALSAPPLFEDTAHEHPRRADVCAWPLGRRRRCCPAPSATSTTGPPAPLPTPARRPSGGTRASSPTRAWRARR